jgi:hypothetical protein
VIVTKQAPAGTVAEVIPGVLDEKNAPGVPARTMPTTPSNDTTAAPHATVAARPMRRPDLTEEVWSFEVSKSRTLTTNRR